MEPLLPEDPTWIGDYRLLGRLGVGGMGRVYLARSEGGRTVAVKLVKAELAQQEEFRARFHLEVEAARRVGGRWTAPVLDADTEATTPWVATGYIAGPSLERVISPSEHGPLPTDSVRTLAYGLASALWDIHGAGLVHRDLKPSNILVTIDGPRVIDFGIARALDSMSEHTFTTNSTVVGSPSFMSPEQIMGESLTTASDVFSLGSVLAFAATGVLPFGSPSGGIHSVMYRITEGEPRLDDVDESLRPLVADCLAKDPTARPVPEELIERVQPVGHGVTASAPWLPAALIAQLGQHAVRLLDTDTPPGGSSRNRSEAATENVTGTRSLPADPPAQEPVPEPAPPRRRRAPWLTVAVVAALLAGGGAAYTAMDDGGGTARTSGDSDILPAMLGTWSGTHRNTGGDLEFRSFTVTSGEVGDVVVSTSSVGADHQCRSDGKLLSGGKRLTVRTKVVDAKPENGCRSGTYRLSRDGGSGDRLRWAATRAGTGESGADEESEGGEELPDEEFTPVGKLVREPKGATISEGYLGTWTTALPAGGTQRLTVRRAPRGSAAVEIVHETPGSHCELSADLLSTRSPLTIGPATVDRAESRGVCNAGEASRLKLSDNQLTREYFDDQNSRTYTKGDPDEEE
ncbi:serine/threonine-protein kinase [Streptomyces sp. NPDC005438]|uniref:serine/threonine-protein kinase n=1 Tax=Streptomyces sp. NPDC005438 TaxID=3156880 RepID=UPI0033BC48C8